MDITSCTNIHRQYKFTNILLKKTLSIQYINGSKRIIRFYKFRSYVTNILNNICGDVNFSIDLINQYFGESLIKITWLACMEWQL